MTEFEINKAVADGEVFVPLTVVSDDPAGKYVGGYERFDAFADCETPSCVGVELELASCETFNVPYAPKASALIDAHIDLSEMEESE